MRVRMSPVVWRRCDGCLGVCLGGREGGVGEQRGRWGRITLRRRLGRGGCRGVAAAPTLAVFCKDGTVIYLATSTFNLVLSPLALSHPRCHGTLLLQTRHGAAPASKIVCFTGTAMCLS